MTGEEGEVTQVLDSLEWRHERFEGAVTHIAISRHRGRTLIEVTRRYANNVGWLYAAAAIVAAAASVVAGTEMQAALALELGVISGLWGSPSWVPGPSGNASRNAADATPRSSSKA